KQFINNLSFMKKTKLLFGLSFILLLHLSGWAQKSPGKKNTPRTTETQQDTSPTIHAYKTQIEQMVSYLQYCLNYIGSDSTWVVDKEEIINHSIFKVVKDSSIMVEDDLDPNRLLPVHKTIQAYLKDVDFFFKHVTFQLRVLDISHKV